MKIYNIQYDYRDRDNYRCSHNGELYFISKDKAEAWCDAENEKRLAACVAQWEKEKSEFEAKKLEHNTLHAAGLRINKWESEYSYSKPAMQTVFDRFYVEELETED